MAIQATDQIKVGDHVRLRNGRDEYLGKVVDEKVIRFLVVIGKNGEEYGVHADALELAPRLTQDEAWAELPYLILEQVHQRTVWGAGRIHEFDQKQIRHECYKLLGGAGIKITEEVKERVRKAIARTAREFNVELA